MKHEQIEYSIQARSFNRRRDLVIAKSSLVNVPESHSVSDLRIDGRCNAEEIKWFTSFLIVVSFV